jgi:uncharacterized protein (DUF342 family)
MNADTEGLKDVYCIETVLWNVSEHIEKIKLQVHLLETSLDFYVQNNRVSTDQNIYSGSVKDQRHQLQLYQSDKTAIK